MLNRIIDVRLEYLKPFNSGLFNSLLVAFYSLEFEIVCVCVCVCVCMRFGIK